jgi:hypothetical protein
MVVPAAERGESGREGERRQRLQEIQRHPLGRERREREREHMLLIIWRLGL